MFSEWCILLQAALQHCRPWLGRTASDRLADGVWCGARRVQSRHYGKQPSVDIVDIYIDLSSFVCVDI